MKADPIPVRARLINDCLPGCTDLLGALPRGRVPMPRSLWRWAVAQATASRLRDRNRSLGLALHCIDTYKDACLASAARQAVGGSRGTVVKPRTSQRPSTGLYCGWVVCPRWARSARCNEVRLFVGEEHGDLQRQPSQQGTEKCA